MFRIYPRLDFYHTYTHTHTQTKKKNIRLSPNAQNGNIKQRKVYNEQLFRILLKLFSATLKLVSYFEHRKPIIFYNIDADYNVSALKAFL